MYSKSTKGIYKNSAKYFIGNRKMNFEKVILYGLNKRGMISKMKIEDFTELINMTDISAPAVLKQKLKLNGKIIKEMSSEEFENDCKII